MLKQSRKVTKTCHKVRYSAEVFVESRSAFRLAPKVWMVYSWSTRRTTWFPTRFRCARDALSDCGRFLVHRGSFSCGGDVSTSNFVWPLSPTDGIYETENSIRNFGFPEEELRKWGWHVSLPKIFGTWYSVIAVINNLVFPLSNIHHLVSKILRKCCRKSYRYFGVWNCIIPH